MNPRSFFYALLAAIFALVSTPAEAQLTTKQVYQEGIRLFKEGSFREALEKFELVLAHKPNDPYARSYATRSKTALAQDLGPKNDIEGQLEKIILPEVNFAEAPIGDVLLYFRSRAEELTGGKLVPNFIYKGTPEQSENTLITLSLRNVPMTEAIKYVGQLAKTKFIYEQHAIVADPNYTAPPNPALDEAAKESTSNTVFGEPAKDVFSQ